MSEFWKKPTSNSLAGFEIDKDEFEDYVENYQPIDGICSLLRYRHADLDNWCMLTYGLNLKDTYAHLLYLADHHNRKAMNSLAKQGNNTAIKVVVEHMMKMGSVSDNETKINFVCNVPNEKSDLEKLIDSEKMEEEK